MYLYNKFNIININAISLQLLSKKLKSDSNKISELVSEKNLENVIDRVVNLVSLVADTMEAFNILASKNVISANFNSSVPVDNTSVFKNINISSIVKKITVSLLLTGNGLVL